MYQWCLTFELELGDLQEKQMNTASWVSLICRSWNIAVRRMFLFRVRLIVDIASASPRRQTVLPTQANSSQVHNFDGVGYRFVSPLAWVPERGLEPRLFRHPLGLSWIELAWIWSSSNFRPTRPRFPLVGHLSQLKPTLAKLLCYCYAVTTRSYSDNWMVSCKLARLGGIVWPT